MPVGTLAAVTFTRKAAAELRGRVQVELEKALRGASGIEKDRLDDAVKHAERAFVGTIHSFCARMLRERPVEARVDSDFAELDEAQDAELRRLAWSEHIERLITARDPILNELEELGVDIGELGSTFERLADYPDVTEWPAPDVAIPDPDRCWPRCEVTSRTSARSCRRCRLRLATTGSFLNTAVWFAPCGRPVLKVRQICWPCWRRS